MARSRAAKFIDFLTDGFADVHKLLSDTGSALSRTPQFYQYEEQLREWRAALTRTGNLDQVRSELIELRSHLRHLGYDVSLFRQRCVFDGFRNDASLAEGFTRVVLFLGRESVYFLTGEENHIALSAFLQGMLERQEIIGRDRIISRHYLWYRRSGNDLYLSGSDTETPDDYRRLRDLAEADPLLFLSRVKRLR
jgi:hypothetical protein